MAHIVIFPLEGVDPELVVGMVLTDPKKIDTCRNNPNIRLASDDDIHWGDPAHWLSGKDLAYFGAEDEYTGMSLSEDLLVKAEKDISAIENYMSDRHFGLLYRVWDGWHGKTTCMFARSSTVIHLYLDPVSGTTPSGDEALPKPPPSIDDDKIAAPTPTDSTGGPSSVPQLSSSSNDDKPTAPTPTDTSGGLRSKAADHHPPNPSLETIYTDEDLDIAADFLHPIIATRFVMLTTAEAAIAEEVYARHGAYDWYEEYDSLVDSKGDLREL